MKTEKNQRFFESQSSGGTFRKIIFILLILTLLITACSTSETSETQETTTDDQGYLGDIDSELEDSDLDSLDDDLDLGWI